MPVRATAADRGPRWPVVAVAVGVCLLLYHYLVVPAGPFGWDESLHATYGLRQARHLQRGDLLGFMRENRLLGSWPILHPWMLAATFLAVGPSLVSARALSLLCFALFVVVLQRVAEECAGRSARLVGLLALAFALTSPMLLIFACQAMLEVPSLLFGWTAMLLYLRTLRVDRLSGYVAAAIAAMLTFFTRYECGLYVAATIAIGESVRFLAALRSAPVGRGERVVARLGRLAVLLVICEGLGVLWWLYHPGFRAYAALNWTQLTHGHDMPFKDTSVPITRGWLLYYPSSVAWDYTGSVLVVVLLVLGVLAALPRLRELRIALLLILIGVGWPVAFFHSPFPPGAHWWPFLDPARFVMMLVPALWILAAIGIAALIDVLRRYRAWAARLAIAVAGLPFVLAAWNVYGAVLHGDDVARVGSPPAMQAYLDIAARVIDPTPRPARILFVDENSRLAPGMIEWQVLLAAPRAARATVLWPVGADDPDAGYDAELRDRLRRANATWIVTTEEPGERSEVGRRAYLRAVDRLPDFELVHNEAPDPTLVMRIYRRIGGADR